MTDTSRAGSRFSGTVCFKKEPTMDDAFGAAPLLPDRVGPLPETTVQNPQTQLNQQPDTPMTKQLLEHLVREKDVELGMSLRAPDGTVGFYLSNDAANGPDEAFMLGREFAHVHPFPDHSLHMTLPDALRSAAISAGWAVPHPMAGLPTISRNLVMVFAPRDELELAVVKRLLTASANYARGLQPPFS